MPNRAAMSFHYDSYLYWLSVRSQSAVYAQRIGFDRSDRPNSFSLWIVLMHCGKKHVLGDH